MSTLRWADLHADAAHLGRIAYRPGARFDLHDHDFAELCWVERGSVRHETTAGGAVLVAGDCLFIQPRHRHALRATAAGGVLVNLAFPRAVLDDLAARYGGPDWPWAESSEARLRRLPAPLLRRCTARAASLPLAMGALDRDALILDVLAGLRDDAGGRWRDLPAWLADALADIADSDELALGVAALAARCGRSREHVARSVRRLLGRRPCDVLNELRLDRAARLLAQGEDGAQAVASRLGFANRTHFHRLFRQRFACTPGEYRRQARATLAC